MIGLKSCASYRRVMIDLLMRDRPAWVWHALRLPSSWWVRRLLALSLASCTSWWSRRLVLMIPGRTATWDLLGMAWTLNLVMLKFSEPSCWMCDLTCDRLLLVNLLRLASLFYNVEHWALTRWISVSGLSDLLSSRFVRRLENLLNRPAIVTLRLRRCRLLESCLRSLVALVLMRHVVNLFVLWWNRTPDSDMLFYRKLTRRSWVSSMITVLSRCDIALWWMFASNSDWHGSENRKRWASRTGLSGRLLVLIWFAMMLAGLMVGALRWRRLASTWHLRMVDVLSILPVVHILLLMWTNCMMRCETLWGRVIRRRAGYLVSGVRYGNGTRWVLGPMDRKWGMLLPRYLG